MSLTYLSGDSIGAKRKRKSKRRGDKDKSSTSGRPIKGKKQRVKKKIAKIALAPARGAFLSAVSLNLFKLGTKLARVWNKPGGKDRLTKMWADKFGGDIGKLKKAIAKGSKQNISGDQIGATAAVWDTALPVIIAIVPLIKELKAGGDQTEMKDFDSGIDEGKKTLSESPEFEKTLGEMPLDADTGVIKKNGNGETTQGSIFSPLGLYFKLPLILSLMNFENSVLLFIAGILSTYCIVGFILYPLSLINWEPGRKFFDHYSLSPLRIFRRVKNYFIIRKSLSHG
jgi:hypothetical protein